MAFQITTPVQNDLQDLKRAEIDKSSSTWPTCPSLTKPGPNNWPQTAPGLSSWICNFFLSFISLCRFSCWIRQPWRFLHPSSELNPLCFFTRTSSLLPRLKPFRLHLHTLSKPKTNDLDSEAQKDWIRLYAALNLQTVSWCNEREEVVVS